MIIQRKIASKSVQQTSLNTFFQFQILAAETKTLEIQIYSTKSILDLIIYDTFLKPNESALHILRAFEIPLLSYHMKW